MNKRRLLFTAVLVTTLLAAALFVIKRPGKMSSVDSLQASQSPAHSQTISPLQDQTIPKQGNASQGRSVEKPARGAFILLQGKPRGGEIRVWVKGTDLKVASAPNDSTEQLAHKIAETINAAPDLHTYGISARATGNEVAVALSEYWLFLCTSDTGLNVPPTPRNLRAKKRDGNLVDLTWQVQKEAYDSVHVLRGTLPIGDDMSGSATNFSDYLTSEDTQTYYVFGVKGRMPSCAATVVVSGK